MQPEYPQPLQASQPEVSHPVSTPNSNRTRLLIIGGIVLVLVIAAAILLLGKDKKSGSSDQGQSAVKALTIGTQPYIYPCSAADRKDYQTIFGLDDGDRIGSQYEETAVPLGTKEGDLAKISPTDKYSAYYRTECDITMAKKGAAGVNTINVGVTQYVDAKEAKDRLTANRTEFSSGAALPPLPSLPETSFVKVPNATETSGTIRASFAYNNLFISLDYSLEDEQGETTANTLPKIDAMAQKIIEKIKSGAAAKKRVDLTGIQSFVGVKFVDICQRTDLGQVAKKLSGIEYRSDSNSFGNTYGALEGSRAAAAGTSSYCILHYRTPTDASAQAELSKNKKATTMNADEQYPHSLNLVVRSFKSAAEAKAALAAQQAREKSPETLSGFGDAAFKTHSERALSGNVQSDTSTSQATNQTDAYMIAKGVDLFTIILVQKKETGATYDTTPLTATDTQIKEILKQIEATLKQNR